MLVETALSVPKSECEGNHSCMCATLAADVCCILHDVEARAIFTVKLTQRSAVMRGHVKLPCDDDDEDDCNHDAAEDDAHDAYQGVPSSSVL